MQRAQQSNGQVCLLPMKMSFYCCHQFRHPRVSASSPLEAMACPGFSARRGLARSFLIPYACSNVQQSFSWLEVSKNVNAHGHIAGRANSCFARRAGPTVQLRNNSGFPQNPPPLISQYAPLGRTSDNGFRVFLFFADLGIRGSGWPCTAGWEGRCGRGRPADAGGTSGRLFQGARGPLAQN